MSNSLSVAEFIISVWFKILLTLKRVSWPRFLPSQKTFVSIAKAYSRKQSPAFWVEYFAHINLTF